MAFEGGSTNNFGSAVTGQANQFWVPEIFSAKAQVAFRKASVTEAICNTDYQGEIASFGDTVNIVKEPQITTGAYTRGATLTNTDLTDEELVLLIDQARQYQFKVDDLETRLSNVNWQALAADNAGYQLKDDMDTNVLLAMSAATGVQTYGSATDVLDVGHASGELDPLNVLSRQARLLDDQNVPEENRWVVASPAFYEQLADTSSKLMSVDYNNGEGSLRNGLVASGQLRGFKLYKSNNIPTWTGTGTSSGLSGNYVMAGHMSSTSCASAFEQTETIRDPATFGDIVRGLLVFGRKVLRPEAIVKAYVNID